MNVPFPRPFGATGNDARELKGSFLYSGSVSGLLENAKGCVWNCTVQNAEEARLLEANYSISSKQYVENGIHMKVLSKEKPNENCVPDNDITLEDAYIYLTNNRE